MIKFKINKSYFSLLLFGMLLNGISQEQLRPLSGNINLPQIKPSKTLASKTTSLIAMDTIPFFDDFSYATPILKGAIGNPVFT